MVTPDGWRIEPAAVRVSLSRPVRHPLRVKRGPYWMVDCCTDEVARHFDLAKLVPEKRG